MRVHLLIILFSGTLIAQAQTSIYQYSCQDLRLDKVLKEIERIHDIKLSFDALLVRDFEVSIDVTTNSSDKLLLTILNGLPLDIRKSQDVFLIIPGPGQPQTITGQIYDKTTGAPLAFAHVASSGGKGTYSNKNGTFTIKENLDSLGVEISYIGYKPTKLVLGSTSKSMRIGLEPQTEILPAFIFSGNRKTHEIGGIGTFSINAQQVSSLPSVGETDLFKSLQLLPGIQATDETNAGLVVRGSSSDQNLVLLDGISLYQLDHFFGIFSSFNPYFISSIDIHKGAFPARYGGRISSVIEATAKPGDFDAPHGGVTLTTTSANVYLETPIGKKTSVNFAFRRSYQELLNNGIYRDFIEKSRVSIVDALDPFSDNSELDLDPEFHFYDLNTKLRFRPNDRNLVDFNLYVSEDNYEGSFEELLDIYEYRIEDIADWGNLGASLNWTKIRDASTTNSLSLNISGYYSSTNFFVSENIFFEDSVEFELEDGDDGIVFFESDTSFVYENLNKANEISDVSIRWESEKKISDNLNYTAGAELNDLSSDYQFTFFDEVIEDFTGTASILSGYGDLQWKPGLWNIQTGLRLSSYSETNTVQIEPRIRVLRNLNNRFLAKAAISRHHQYFNRLAISPFGNNDQYHWVLADGDTYPIMQSDHLITGIEYAHGDWKFDLEAYWKKSRNIIESEFEFYELYDEAPSTFDEFIRNGINESKGVDIFLNRKTDKSTSWISYSLLSSENSFDFIDEGRFFPSAQDQRNELNLVHIQKVGKWDLSTVFVYGSGKPYTPPSEFDEEEIFLFYDTENINSLRLPNYHRLDISAKRSFNWTSVKGELGLTLFNVYNRTNIRSRRYSLFTEYDEFTEDFDSEIVPIDIPLLGFTPNIFLSIRL